MIKSFLLKHSLVVFAIGILFSPFSVLAQNSNTCSPEGYTILTINGIFTDKEKAADNKRALQDKLLEFYPNFIFNSQPLTVDYLHNESHLAGFGDLVKAVSQGLFNQKNDYDLVEMLVDASEKVRTQKLLLVGHSQGNFYTNSFYETVVDKQGGVPWKSMGVYGIASPATFVAGGGKYITSDTDNVINKVRKAKTMNVRRVLDTRRGSYPLVPLRMLTMQGYNFTYGKNKSVVEEQAF